MDFIVTGSPTQALLDAALAALGFAHKGDRSVHPRVPFDVEFPRGPLAIGNDYRIRPVQRVAHGRRWLALSATDSCRDRLAAKSLRVDVQIARAQRVTLADIRRWSVAEGFSQRFDEFLADLRAARTRRRPGGGPSGVSRRG